MRSMTPLFRVMTNQIQRVMETLGMPTPILDCYWVGSLDFNCLVEIKGFSTKPPQKVQLVAGGSTATKHFGPKKCLPKASLLSFAEWHLAKEFSEEVTAEAMRELKAKVGRLAENTGEVTRGLGSGCVVFSGVSAQIGSGVVRGVVPPGFHQGSTRFCEGCGVVRALKRAPRAVGDIT